VSELREVSGAAGRNGGALFMSSPSRNGRAKSTWDASLWAFVTVQANRRRILRAAYASGGSLRHSAV